MAPGAGDRFYVLDDISAGPRTLPKSGPSTAGSSELERRPAARHPGEPLRAAWARQARCRRCNIILRADVRGSIEAIRKELTKLQHPEVQIKILQATVGGITEADVHLADASDAVIIGFSVVPDEGPAVWPRDWACRSAATTSSTR